MPLITRLGRLVRQIAQPGLLLLSSVRPRAQPFQTMSSSSTSADTDPATAPATAPPQTQDTPATEPQTEEACAPQPQLPPLSPAEFHEYNRLAEHMDGFHNHFRHTWTVLHNACSSGRRPANLSLRGFLDEGLHFVRMLTMHHDIEETYYFPLLAAKMPEFRKGRGANQKAAELLMQHRQIHAGMDGFADYLRQCRNRETELELSVMKEKMDSWGEVLWKHLDQEVKTLGAENMRRVLVLG